MKKFIGILKKESSLPEAHSDHVPEGTNTRASASITSESDSLQELRPMFLSHRDQEGPSNHLELNLNPSICPPSLLTRESDSFLPSVFSSHYTKSTNQSSYASYGSKKPPQRRQLLMGRTLQTMDIPSEVAEFKDGRPIHPADAMAEKLRQLSQDMAYISNHHENSVTNLSTSVVEMISCLKDFVLFTRSLDRSSAWSFSAFDNGNVRKILRTYLHYYDNLLRDDAFIRSKLLLCKSFNDFVSCLKSSSAPLQDDMRKPQNYSIGNNDGSSLPNVDLLARIMNRIVTSNAKIHDQNGSFIAPIARGVASDMVVLCLYFGSPAPSENHWRLVPAIHELYDDIHVVIAKNHIEPASATAQSASIPLDGYAAKDSQRTQPKHVPTFKMPFRNPSDWEAPPMSISVSTESSIRVSGTMGGYIYPMIDAKRQPQLRSYAESKFAISCGHVCLDKREGNVEYPYISSPLAVLVNLYKQALTAQYEKFAQSADDATMLESKVAYASVLNQLDELFPLKRVKVYDHKLKQEKADYKNLPKHRFGQIIWGERTLILAKRSKDGQKIAEKRLSDLAIIKVNKLLKCDQNYLGDDIALNEYDPSLIFENLYVRKIIGLGRLARDLNDSVNEVDSFVSTPSRDSDGNATYGGLPVFKYGSTTKYTRGYLNGIKLVYWLDGAMHSSEFVVNSFENTTAFAAGGDSGSWILSKLEDVKGTPENKGLAVAGMLHSYDGEFRQFGLFSPMTEILDRLEEVTKIKWGVVGVQEKGTEALSGDSESEFESDSDASTEYESLSDEQLSPPID